MDDDTGAEIVVDGHSRMRFPEISPRAYEHPTDRGALVALRSVPGFDAVLKALSGAVSERSERLLFLASSVRVGPAQYPELSVLRDECASTLDLPEVPELYVYRNPMPNAMAIGMDRPFVVLTTGLVELLDTDGLRFAIGHEMGHVLSGHALYRTMLLRLIRLAQAVAWMPVGYWGVRTIVAALREWHRKSELSCDRAGLLCGQDLAAAMRVHALLAGAIDPDAVHEPSFLEQAREYEAAGDVRDSVLKLLQVIDTEQPMAVVRSAQLRKWAASDEYQAILAGTYPRRGDDPDASFLAEVKTAASNYRQSWRDSADPLTKVVSGVGETVTGAADSLRRWFRSDAGPDSGPDNGPDTGRDRADT